MESPSLSPSHADASRPSLGFPLGTALLLLIIFSLSGIFSCCYHWDKLRSLRQSISDGPGEDPELAPSKPRPTLTGLEKKQNQSLPVLMPGDEVPKFIALPCPCEPPKEKFVPVTFQKPPPKLPRIAVPLY
ncbi:hypothetical protein SAY87_032145 [Trapa incisa]|uniref:Hydroxyproline-rich glycoprotein family protein n=1 Tax=Trapa incisa TaxID=236973 RepID=A0AAN7KLP8_9MYRT|nr:hypothetical protein SAY87_032145 [Trapa incisa]